MNRKWKEQKLQEAEKLKKDFLREYEDIIDKVLETYEAQIMAEAEEVFKNAVG